MHSAYAYTDSSQSSLHITCIYFCIQPKLKKKIIGKKGQHIFQYLEYLCYDMFSLSLVLA